jgi:transcriptional regulator GlxA family with amidase domain
MMNRVGLLVFPGFQILNMVAVSVFELANAAAANPVYTLELVSEEGGPVKSSSGVQVETRAFGGAKFDTLLVSGTMTIEPSSPGLLAFLRDASKKSRRISRICTGAFVLAEAGLLDGRRATTHWHYARELQRSFPRVKVQEDCIYIVDGPVWTSAGMTACMDLSLALIEGDLGVDVSREVARPAPLELEPRSERIQDALTYAKENLHLPLSVDRQADVAHLSPRQFSRAFLTETGQSPARAIEKLRVETARALIEDGHSIERVAEKAGFSDPERMRRAFHRAFGQPAQALRRAARLHAAA